MTQGRWKGLRLPAVARTLGQPIVGKHPLDQQDEAQARNYLALLLYKVGSTCGVICCSLEQPWARSWKGERESFLPRRLLVEISDRHQTMTLEDRAVSTLALMTVIRFLAAELSHTVQEADSFARARENSRRLEGEPDTDDDLLLQLSMLPHGGQGREMHPEACEEAGFMQLFFADDGKDSLQQRWSRNMLRLQKELMQQEDAIRRGCISTLLLALGAVMSEGVRDSWQGQLHALLVSVMADTTRG